MKFDSKLKLKSSTKIKPMPENAMRPTAILWRNTDIKKNPKLLMIGDIFRWLHGTVIAL